MASAAYARSAPHANFPAIIPDVTVAIRTCRGVKVLLMVGPLELWPNLIMPASHCANQPWPPHSCA